MSSVRSDLKLHCAEIVMVIWAFAVAVGLPTDGAVFAVCMAAAALALCVTINESIHRHVNGRRPHA